jgi:hypothetical protein
LDRKPIQPHPADQISHKEARDEVAAADVKRQIVGNVYKRRKIRKTARQMMIDGKDGGPMSPDLKDRLDNNPELDVLRKRAHLLGPLYLDLSYFNSRKEAATFFNDHGIPVKDRMVVGAPQKEDEVAESDFSLRDPRVMNSLVQRYASQKFGSAYSNETQAMQRIASYLVQADDEKLLSFAQQTFSDPVPQEVNDYDTFGKPIYDPTEGITTKEAWNELKQASVTSEKVSETTSDRNRLERFASHMARTPYHDENILDQINSDPKLASLRSDLHLLGKLYTDSSHFTSREAYQEFLEENPDLEALPDKAGRDLEEFLSSSDRARDLLRRRARQLDDFAQITQKTSSLGELARWTCKTSARKAAKNYEGKVYKFQGTRNADHYDLDEGQARKVIDATSDEPIRIQDFDLRSFIKKSENGEEILQKLVHRLNHESIKAFYLSDEGITASVVHDHQDEARSVVATITADRYEPKGLSRFPSELVQTKVGRWMRDRMLEGKTGSELSNELENTFSKGELLEKAPVIATMREEEGLYGRTYVTADSFSDCREGRDSIPDTVNQIVRSDKCSDCVHNRGDSCGLYQADLVDEPSYDKDTVLTAINHRLNNGSVSMEESERMMDLDLDPKTKTRVAHIENLSITSEDRQTIAAPFSGYYGEPSQQREVKKKDVQSMLRYASEKAQSGKFDKYHLKKLITSNFDGRVILRGSEELKEILSNVDSSQVETVVDHDSTKAPTGLDNIQEFDLAGSAEMNDLDIDEEQEQETLEIDQMGGMNLDF